MTEVIRYGLIGAQDVRTGSGTFEVTLSDGRVVTLNELSGATAPNLMILPAYTLASLPPAGTAGRLARVTDGVERLYVDNGTAWIPASYLTGDLLNTLNSIYIGGGGKNSVAPDARNNTAVGFEALLSNTIARDGAAFGFRALKSNTTGLDNTAIGQSAMENSTTGSNNVAVGEAALFTSTTGASNTAVGLEAMYFNTTGGGNVAVGHAALTNNTTASDNVAVGFDALKANTTGTQNVAVGRSASATNTVGADITAVGRRTLLVATSNGNSAFGSTALVNVSTGADNSGVGVGVGATLTTGSNNSFLGRDADVSSAAASFRTVIGSNASGTIDNSITLGRTADRVVVPGRMHIPVVATASLPAAGAAEDGSILIEDAGAGDRNLIIYAASQRFRIDGGVAF